MADKNIKGITVEIGGESVGLSKAMQDVNKESRDIQSELRQIEKLLKFDPSNVEMLAQKQELLGKSVEGAAEKLRSLRDVQEQVEKKFQSGEISAEAYRAFQREVAGAEGELKKAEKAADGFGDEIKESGEAADDAGGRFEKLGGVLKGVGAAMGTAAVAAGAAAVKLGKEVVQQFGELEQNLGGSEAVFGEYAERIQKTGEDAYKNMGVSQSDYLATANKMGALFQGTGIEQQKSLELTEKAMQRAADMASVMGIDMQTALDSVAGAAKGNFTMMDNLGVAMNATTIEAYALSKGITTAYKDMSQTEKAEIAMQMFFENTEQYAGNFARESTETVTGSLGLLTAATQSFVAGLGNADADMTNLTKNIVDAFQAVVGNVTPIIENIADALPEVTAALLPALGEILPTLLDTAAELFNQVLETLLSMLPELIPAAVEAIMTIVGALIDNLPLLIDAAVQLITALVTGIGEALPELIPAAVNAITTIVQGMVDNLPMLLDAALQLMLGLAEGLLAALPELIDALPEIITAMVDFFIDAIPQIIETGVALLVALVDALPEIIDGIVAAIPEIIGGIVDALVGNIDKIIAAGVTLFIALVDNLPQIIIEIVKAIPKIITAMVEAFASFGPKLAETGTNLIKGLWQGISDAGAWLREKISGFFGGVVDSIKNFFGIHSPSTLFAGLGVNMAEGLGLGFGREMDRVAADMRDAIPDDFDLPGVGGSDPVSAAYGAIYSGWGGTDAFDITIPMYMDGQKVGRVVSRVQYSRSLGKARVVGVTPA